MSTYRLDILVTANDKASGPLTGVQNALSRIMYVATGVLIASAIHNIIDFFGNLISGAFEAHDRLERLGIALETLIAIELSRGQVAEETSTYIRHLTEEEILQVDKLRLEYFDLQTQLGDLQQEYADVTAEYGEHSMEALAVSVALRETQAAMEDVGGEIERLNSAEGSLITTTEMVRTGQISMRDALAQAVGPAKDLLHWIEQLALVSPFKEEDVFRVFNMAAGFGFATQFASELLTEEEKLQAAQDAGVVTAQRLTLALLDMGSVSPAVADGLARIIKGLGDMKAAGKVLSLDLRQLYNAGITMEFLAYSMGLTVAEFQALQQAGLSSDEMILALVETIERDFGGASDRLLDTLAGLKLGFADLGPIMGRNFIDPLIQALLPGLREFFELMTTPEAFAAVHKAGIQFRDMVLGIGAALKFVYDLLTTPISVHLEAIDLPELFTSQEKARITLAAQDFFGGIWDSILPPSAQEMVSGQVSTLLGTIQAMFQQAKDSNFGFEDPAAAAAGGTGALGAVLGIGGLVQFIAPGGRLWAVLGGAFTFISGIALKIFGKIGIVGLAVSLLAAAWSGNWLGIQDVTMDVWNNTIKPFLMEDLPRIIKEDVPRLLGEFKVWWGENIVTPFKEGFSDIKVAAQQLVTLGLEYLNKRWTVIAGELRENVLPGLAEIKNFFAGPGGLIESVITFVSLSVGGGAQAVADFFEPFVMAVAPPIIDAARWVITEYLPTVLDFFIFLGGEAGTSFINLVDKGLRPMAETFLKLGAIILVNVLPWFKDLVDLFIELRTTEATELKRAYDEFFKPVLEGFWELWEDHVIPLAETFITLLGDIADLGLELFNYTWKTYVEPFLTGMYGFMFTYLNPVVDGFFLLLDGINNMLGIDLKQTIDWFVDHVLPDLLGGFDSLGGILDGIRGVLQDIIDLLGQVEVPDPVEENSPSEMALAFLHVADAIQAVNDAYNDSEAFNISSPGWVTNGTHSQGAAVYVGGDSNTFIVSDRGMADYITHQLREGKRKRFDEYMGRSR